MNCTQSRSPSVFFNGLKSSCTDTHNNPEHSFSLKPSGFSYTKWLFKNFRSYYTSLGTGVPLNSLKYATHNSEVAGSLHFNHLNANQTTPLSFLMLFHHFYKAENQFDTNIESFLVKKFIIHSVSFSFNLWDCLSNPQIIWWNCPSCDALRHVKAI